VAIEVTGDTEVCVGARYGSDTGIGGGGVHVDGFPGRRRTSGVSGNKHVAVDVRDQAQCGARAHHAHEVVAGLAHEGVADVD
jgi:hypothetical protein